jgi:hypothetical protein
MTQPELSKRRAKRIKRLRDRLKELDDRIIEEIIQAGANEQNYCLGALLRILHGAGCNCFNCDTARKEAA